MVAKGSKLSLETQQKISEALKNSKKFHEAMRNRKSSPMKGHNYGKCKKCGKIRVHPKGMAGKHHREEAKRKMSRAHMGKPSPLKGRKNPKVAEAMRNRIWTSEMRANMSKAMKGRPSHRKGKYLLFSHRLNIARGLRESEIFRESIRMYHEGKVKDFLRKLYDIPKNVVFFPASRYEHEFARFVLIEGYASGGFITYSGLRERSEWEKSNANESEIPVVVA